jgi:hypothetical protein
VLAVERVGAGDVHDVDVGVGDQRGVRPVGTGPVVALDAGEGFGGRLGPGADRGDHGTGHLPEVRGEVTGDPAGREDAPAGGR